ncbi:uncharacterized protein RhoGAP54D isoform X2 [Venturia canescens]|uniref:uncharacterized protein RhoGAP54D isoform X2 n=1 Tax=Venturia canescens TaxID=32260 RepID=UPI001C9BC30D|nr:uncharacterized protein LOC122407205 isoform X2 [Venturia canescens]
MKMDDFNEGVDGKLASRMRKVNQEQFLTLVKMHLSFELDLNTEDNDCTTEKAKLKKWGLLSFSKKPKSSMSLQRDSDGANLTAEGINQVKQLIVYLSKEQCISQEGIFRRTGKLTRQHELKAALYQGVPLELENGPYSVHDCASVLKTFLAELSEPLLTELHYPAHCQIAELCTSDSSTNEPRLLSSLQLLLLLLPPANRTLLRQLLDLLNKTAACESSNKMNCDTLATLFTPHLMCPRKLSPEALHTNSQHLSGLVAFMIRRGTELFEIPPKLATDIRAYWVEQERKLLSPKKSDLNESMSDTTGTAHTVFSFVDHQLTAKANSTQDTQAALAQLYAHIQAMPESAKKRRLVKQFNKENGQGTPRHVKQYRTKSLGDSIKKHIFQKKILGHKKLVDINIGTNISRSSSEENILSAIKRISNSTGSLDTSILESYKSKCSVQLLSSESMSQEGENEAILKKKNEGIATEKGKNTPRSCSHVNSNTSNIFVTPNSKVSNSFVTPNSNVYETPKSQSAFEKLKRGTDSSMTKKRRELMKENFAETKTENEVTGDRLLRHKSEPPNMYSTRNVLSLSNQVDNNLMRRSSDSGIGLFSKMPNIEIVSTPTKVINDKEKIRELNRSGLSGTPNDKKNEVSCTIAQASPVIKNKFWQVYAAHTSTPSDLLRRNLANGDYMLTPLTNSDKSMSPITQSTTKMSRAMQETMMTPRSRKPVMMISGSNLCNLATLDNSWAQSSSNINQARGSSITEAMNRKNCESILEESHRPDGTVTESSNIKGQKLFRENKKSFPCYGKAGGKDINFVESPVEDCGTTIQRSSMSITSTFREYLLSRSVLTASPVDLSFSSRTGDFEQSESDLNMLSEEGLSDSLLHCLDGNNPGSDTSGIASGSTNSANNSLEKIEDIVASPRKRGTSLQRHDSKRSVKTNDTVEELKQQHTMKHKQMSESTLNFVKIKENVQETSF